MNEQREWIRPGEKRPEPFVEVFVVHNAEVKKGWCLGYHNSGERWRVDRKDFDEDQIHFWMPIPPIPASEHHLVWKMRSGELNHPLRTCESPISMVIVDGSRWTGARFFGSELSSASVLANISESTPWPGVATLDAGRWLIQSVEKVHHDTMNWLANVRHGLIRREKASPIAWIEYVEKFGFHIAGEERPSMRRTSWSVRSIAMSRVHPQDGDSIRKHSKEHLCGQTRSDAAEISAFSDLVEVTEFCAAELEAWLKKASRREPSTSDVDTNTNEEK